jgi:hypothetical protein
VKSARLAERRHGSAAVAPLALVPSLEGAGDAAARALALAIALDGFADSIVERVAEKLQAAAPEPKRAALERHEIAAALGISLSSLDRLRGEDGFPELRIGEAPRFILADVLDYLRARGTRS